MSVAWKITSRTPGQPAKTREVDIDERIGDVAPLEKGLCGFMVFSWLQPAFSPVPLERAPPRALTTNTGECTVKARISGGQPVTFKVPFGATVDDLNYRAKEVLGINSDPMSWADKLEGVSVCFATPWGASE